MAGASQIAVEEHVVPLDTPMVGLLDIFFLFAGLAMLIVLWRADVIRPGSFRRRDERDVSAWPWWVWGIGLFFSMVAGAMGAGFADVFFQAAERDDLTRLGVVSAVGGLSSAVVALALMTRGLPTLVGRTRPEGTHFRLSWRGVWLGLLALVVVLPVVQLVSMVAVLATTVLTGRQPELIAHDTLRALVDEPGHPGVWLMVCTAVVIAPLTEEVLFRGFLQSMLLRALRSTWGAVLLTSALFSLVHWGAGVPAGQEFALVPIFVLGVAMGVAYERTRNLLVPVVMHIGFNGLNVLLAIVQY